MLTVARHYTMPISVEQIESEALLLPEEERANLAKSLITSLDEPNEFTEEEVERAWEEEIQLRIDLFEAGEIEAIPASEVFREMRRIIQ